MSLERLETEEILLAAWKALAENPNVEKGFPRGFWPDLARVAVEMARQQTLSPLLDFRPCRSGDVVIRLQKGVRQGLPAKDEPRAVDKAAENPFQRFA